jgi:hypothetical protein
MVCRHVIATGGQYIKNDTKINTDMSTLVTARQKLESQQQENKGVQKVCDETFLENTSKKSLTNLPGVQLTRRRCQHIQAGRPCFAEARHYRGEEHSRRSLGVHWRRNVRAHEST